MDEEYSTLDKVIDQIGYLMNSVDPTDEINKLITLEFTVNSETKDLNYRDVMTKVIVKLVEFYNDPELEALWTEYLLELEDEDFDQVA